VNDIEKGITTFKDVEYKTTDAKNRDYITKGNEAKITKDKPDLIELQTVHSFTNLKDGTVLNINSEKADYFKKTKNIKYYQNVVITNKDTVITSDIANYFAKKNLIRLEGNVVMQDPKNKIKGDIAELDTITNNLEVFMNKKKIKFMDEENKSKNKKQKITIKANTQASSKLLLKKEYIVEQKQKPLILNKIKFKEPLTLTQEIKHIS
jgi:lipopolysaccharide assembly outer membrane protein LptD (OstA)